MMQDGMLPDFGLRGLHHRKLAPRQWCVKAGVDPDGYYTRVTPSPVPLICGRV
jgi:hypothetical protein